MSGISTVTRLSSFVESFNEAILSLRVSLAEALQEVEEEDWQPEVGDRVFVRHGRVGRFYGTVWERRTDTTATVKRPSDGVLVHVTLDHCSEGNC